MMHLVAAAALAANLTALWRAPYDGRVTQVVLAPDEKVAIAGSDSSVAAFSAADGRFVWRRSDLRTPIALSGDRIVARGTNENIAVIDVRTGRTLWTSARLGSEVRGIAGDDDLVVASAIRGSLGSFQPSFVTAFSANDGRVRWNAQGDTELGDDLTLAPTIVLRAYDAGEPHFSWVEIRDSSTGKLLETYRGSYHDRSAFGRTLWLSQSEMTWDGTEKSPAVVFDRYDVASRKEIDRYAYSPGPLPLDQMSTFYPDYDTMVPLALTQDALFVQITNRLYRYDRALAPDAQTPAGQTVTGKLVGAIGDSVPLLLEGSNLAVAVPDRTGAYALHAYDLSAEMPQTTIEINGGQFPNGGVFVRESNAAVAYADAKAGGPYWLLAATAEGAVFVADQNTCGDPGQPNAVALLQGGDAVVACRGSLVRVSVRAHL